MPEREPDNITLPEGAEVLELDPYEPSVELALEVAQLGVSDEAVRALGGEEALQIVRERRDEMPVHENGNGNGTGA